ncbi:MAG: hypothetical protein LBE46_05200 [Wolbachia pipientis]|jgi:hypothetical protein|nr:hypothetical protein [Wolbachia pipientis]
MWATLLLQCLERRNLTATKIATSLVPDIHKQDFRVAQINDLERINSLNRSIERTGMATAFINNKAIFFGGLEDDKPSGKVDIYNTTTREWEEGEYSNQADVCTGGWEKYLHEERQNATVGVINSKAIFFGGRRDRSTISNKIDIYDSKSGKWEKDTHEASEGRENPAVAVVNNKVIFFGGRRSYNTYSSKIDIYDSETEKWEICETNEPRENVAVAEIGNKVIFFGGRDGVSTSSKKIDIYDVVSGKWEENVPDASEARENAAVAVIGDKTIFFFGDRINPGSCSSAIDIYNAKTGEWNRSAYDTSELRENIAVAVIGSRVIFFGGRTSAGSYSASVDIYDADTETWKKDIYSASEAREGAAVAVVNKKAIFFGGKKGPNQYSSKVETYDYETDKWESFDVKVPLKDIIVSNKDGMVTFIGRDVSNNVQKYVLNDKGVYSEGELNFSYRFIHLSRKLDWSFSELSNTLIAIGKKEFDKDAIEEITRIKNLQKRFEQPLGAILGFYLKPEDDLLNITENLPGILPHEIRELSKDNCSKLKSIINQDVKTYFKLDQDDDKICALFDSFTNGKTEEFQENEKPFILFLQKTILLSKLTGTSIENLVQLMLTLKVQEINIVEIAPSDEIQELSKNNCSKLKNVINQEVKAHFKLSQDDRTICTSFINFTKGKAEDLEENIKPFILLLHKIILLSRLTGVSIENLVKLILKLEVQEINIDVLELITNISNWFNEQGFSIESFEKVLNLIDYKTVLLSKLEKASIKEFVQLMLSLDTKEASIEKIADTLKLRDWLDEYNFSIEMFDELNHYHSKVLEKAFQIKGLIEKDEVVNRKDFYKAIQNADIDEEILDATYNFTEEYIDRRKDLESLGKSINRAEVTRVTIGNKLIFFGGIENNVQYSAKIDIYDIKKERWEKEDFEASEARIAPMVARINNKILFFCGKKGETEYSQQVDIYDSVTEEWTEHTVNEGRTGAALAVVGKEVIFFCGYNGNYYSSKIDIYDSVSGEWRENQACEVRENAKVAVIDDKKAVFFSGYNFTDYRIEKGKSRRYHKFSGKIDVYDATNAERWSYCAAEELNKILEKNSRGSDLDIESAVIKNQAIFFGIYRKDQGEYVSIKVVYDSKSGEVYDESQETSTPYRNSSVAIACKNKAIFFGTKKSGNEFFSKAEIYDAVSKKWEEKVHNASELRKNQSVAIIRDVQAIKQVVFFGGEKRNNEYSSKIEIYDAENEKWITGGIPEASEPRENASVAVVGNKAIFFGGRSGASTFSSKVDIYDAGSRQWKNDIYASEPRENASVTLIGDKVIFFGGEKGENQYSSMVDIYDSYKDGKWRSFNIDASFSEIEVVTEGNKANFIGRDSAGSMHKYAVGYPTMVDQFLENVNTFTKVGLEGESIENIVKYGNIFGVEKPWLISMDQIKILLKYKKLDKKFASSTPNFSEYVHWLYSEGYQPDQVIEKVSILGKWNKETLEKIKGDKDFEICFGKDNNPIDSLLKIELITNVINESGINVDLLLKLKNLHNVNLTSDTYNKYEEIATTLRSLITLEEEDKIIEDLEEKKLDILVGFTISKYENVAIKNTSDLYSFLLIDVEISGCSRISELKAALNSMQLYIHRCILGLEKEATVNQDPEKGLSEKMWDLLDNYREWEAAKKIALYPENYLNPTLRKSATAEYKALQNTLMQGNLTDEAAAYAYIKYFEDFAQLVNLQIVDMYFAKEKEKLYVIGRTQAEPYIYYYRVADFKGNQAQNWLPWEEFDTKMPVSIARIVHAFGKVFIFWLQETKKEKQIEDISISDSTLSVNYIFKKVDGSWSAQQKLPYDIKINEEFDSKIRGYLSEIDIHKRHIGSKNENDSANSYCKEQIEKLKGSIEDQVKKLKSYKFYGKLNVILNPEQEILIKSMEQGFQNSEFVLMKNLESKEKVKYSFTNSEYLAHKSKNLEEATKSIEDSCRIQKEHYDEKIKAEKKEIEDKIKLKDKRIEDFRKEKEKLEDDRKVQDDEKKAKEGQRKELQDVIDSITERKKKEDELEKQVEGLKEQLDDLQRQESIQDGLPQVPIEKEKLKEAIDNLKERLKKSKEVVKSKKEEVLGELNNLETEAANSIGKENDLYGKVVSLKQQLDDLQKKESIQDDLVHVLVEKGKLQKAIDNLIERLTQSKQTVESGNALVQAQLQSLEDSTKALTGQEDQLLKKVKDLKERLDNLQQRKFIQDTLQRISVVRGKLHEAIDNLKDRLSQSKQIVESKEKKVQDQLIKLEREAAKLIGEIDELLKGKTIEALERKKSELEKENGTIDEIEEKISQLNKKLDDLNGKIDTKTERIKDFEEEKKVLEKKIKQEYNEDTLAQKKEEEFKKLDEKKAKDIEEVTSLFNQKDTANVSLEEPIVADFIDKSYKEAYVGGSEVILTFGQEVNAADRHGNTSLHQKVKSGSLSEIKELIDRGAISLKNKAEKTPLDLARGKENIKEFLETAKSFNESFYGFYGVYLWEIFFHIPTLIAYLFNQEQKFAEARKWYQYIFNPTKEGCSAWQFIPFKAKCENSDNPDEECNAEGSLDPYMEAEKKKKNSFEKYVIVSYVDNLIDWGDMLFSKNSWEGINQATMLYIRAWSLLGNKPEKKKKPSIETQNICELSNGKYTTICQVEAAIPRSTRKNTRSRSGAAARVLDTTVYCNYFCTPENKEFIDLWERIEDRLYKIRHCLDIKGKRLELPLFQPPIDPRQLVSAAAGGGAIGVPQVVQVPHYRFKYMISYAKSIADTVTQVGSELLNVIEKKDAEALTIFYNKQEGVMANLITTIKEKAIEALKEEAKALNASLSSAKERKSHYEQLIEKGWSNLEISSMVLSTESTIALTAAGIARQVGAVAHFLPTIFGFSCGGFQPGSAADSIARVLEVFASVTKDISQDISVSASYERRAQDWTLQKTMATHDIEQIGYQISANKISQANAEQDLKAHKESIKQIKEKEEFFKSKFTSQELYSWMKGELSNLYFQIYKLALTIARQAERAYQYEVDNDKILVQSGHWDSLKQGLLTGQKLKFDLEQMDKEYHDSNERRLEITKVISLKQLDPIALYELKTKGYCRFSFTEKLFDLDFPGHYARKIKDIKITIPAVVGPYENVHASLQQASNQVVLKSDGAINAIKYLLNPSEEEQPENSLLRVNWKQNQEIAISRADQDSGLFELSFGDERYLPFEGTGAVSSWELSIPQATNRFDTSTISDIIIHLDYTALSGGKLLSDRVKGLEQLKHYYGNLVISLSSLYPEEWSKFKQGQDDKLVFKPSAKIFPTYTTKPEVDLDKGYIYVIPKTLKDLTRVKASVNGHKVNFNELGKVKISSNDNLPEVGSDWELKIDPSELEEIAVIIPYKAEINWKQG